MFRSSEISNNDKERWLRNYARIGYYAKGIVYCLMGVVTTLAAFGLSAKKADKQHAFKVILDQPFGQVLLVIIALGLLGYVMLRVFQTFLDTSNKGKDAEGIFRRIGYGISALLYFALSIYAIKLAFGNGGGGGSSRQFFISKVMEYPAGTWIVGIVACIVIGNGIYQIYRGGASKFMKRVKLYKSSYGDTFKRIGMIGFIARGAVLCIIGYFLLQAALNANPGEAQGTEGAFDFLQKQFGNVLMAVVAVGLVAYGVFMFVRARHEKMDVDVL